MIKGEFEFRVEAGFTTDNVRDIYEGGVPSSITKDSEMSMMWRPLYDHTDGAFHPADWYSHCPNTSIAYLRSFGPSLPAEGKIVARTIVYHNAKGVPETWGPMYAGDSMFYNILAGLLDKEGVGRPRWGNANWVVTSPFEVQGFESNDRRNRWICPFPYLDIMDSPYFHVNNDTGKFTFGQREHLIDNGMRACYPVTRGGPTHYGLLRSGMRDGMPGDNQWMAQVRRRN